MNDQWYKHLIGARTIKTGIAIFNSCLLYGIRFNTYLCHFNSCSHMNQLPRHHLLKVIVDYLLRYGAGFAVLFTYLFGDQSPFTYALSATFTILFCTKLKLQVGTNVAVLTSLAMIPGIHDAYIFNFCLEH